MKSKGGLNLNLIPKLKPQQLTYDTWQEHTPCENKLELIDGEALWDGEQRDRLLMALVYNVGLKHLVDILSDESKQALCQLCQGETK